jgi:uncharacterized protein (TIGR02646 family)
MKNIVKEKEPKTLVEYRCAKKSNLTYKSARYIFDNYKDKNKGLKQALLEDQGYICCYCMQRIEHKPNTKIEHFKPISKYPEKTLDYNNLFVACNGIITSESTNKEERKIRHCDTSKGDCEGKQRTKNDSCDLTINPISGEKYITQYSNNGEIEYLDLVKNDIEEVLNLNNHILKRNRKTTLKAVIIEITKKRKSAWTVSQIKNKIKEYQEKNGKNKYKPYCQVIIYFLEKRLSILSSVNKKNQGGYL